jgi:mannose/fructose-specific phosphotransferase system component IIA
MDLIGLIQGDPSTYASLFIEANRNPAIVTICDLCVFIEAYKRRDNERLRSLVAHIAIKAGLKSVEFEEQKKIVAYLFNHWQLNSSVITGEQYDNCLKLNY